MLIIGGFIVFLLGVGVVLSDCYSISNGMTEGTVLEGLIHAGRLFGYPDWQAFALWLLPMHAGFIVLMWAVWERMNRLPRRNLPRL